MMHKEFYELQKNGKPVGLSRLPRKLLSIMKLCRFLPVMFLNLSMLCFVVQVQKIT